MTNRLPMVAAGILLIPGLCLAAAHRPTIGPEGVTFTHEAPHARDVHLAGDFNGWHPAQDAMTKDKAGTWTLTIPLKPGRYEYKFIIDGGETWKHDVTNPLWVSDSYGGRNSVLIITREGRLDFSRRTGRPAHAPIVASLKGYSKPLYLAIMWHQHQPKYIKDPATGEYLEPWVRIHGIKDYYDMAAILADYPAMKFTINLTPVLLMQIKEIIKSYDAWVSAGRTGPIPGCDKWVRLALTPPNLLTRDEKAFILRNFFRMPRDAMIEPHRRFSELASKKLGDSEGEIDRTIETFTENDWRDLQAWFNLAEFDPAFRRESVTLPDGETVTVRHLVGKSTGYTDADLAEIIDTQMKILKSIIPVHQKFVEEGRLEIITSPYYHPILPLLCDTDVAAEANLAVMLPAERFAYPEDARAQVELGIDYYSEVFGDVPNGLWPSEGSVSEAILPIVADLGIRYIATDEWVLSRTLGKASLDFDEKYMPYRFERGGKGVAVVFRDHMLSDDIAIKYARMDGVEAANDMISSLHRIHRASQAFDDPHIVAIILDGDNAWEHFADDGKKFLNSLYYQVSEAEWLIPVTISDYLEEFPPERALPSLAPGSWIAADFDTWIGENEENTAWVYLAEARRAIDENRGAAGEGAVTLALSEVYAAEGSDWFWWYGLDRDIGNDVVFDEAFRGTLKQVYEHLGVDTPAYLDIPIIAPGGVEPKKLMTKLVTPIIDGKVTSPGEWEDAAFIDGSGGAMAGSGGELARAVHCGYDRENLYLRVDPGDRSYSDCDFDIYLSGRPETGLNVYTRGRRLSAPRSLGFGIGWDVVLSPEGGGTALALKASGEGAWAASFESPAAFGEIFEVAIPFSGLSVSSGDDLKFVIVGYCDDGEVDVIPGEGLLSFRVPALGTVEVLASMPDSAGDDYGPGYYKYPTDSVFIQGSFDITSLDVMIENSEKLIFKVGVRSGLHSPWGGVTGYSLQALDIYIDTDGVPGSGVLDLYTARGAVTVPEHAWEYYVRACMDTVAIYERGRRLDDIKVNSYADRMTSSILIEVPLAAIEGGKEWSVIVALLGHDGYGAGQIRRVAATEGQWVFGGCRHGGLCPAIIDLVLGERVSQEEVLSSYLKTGKVSSIPGFKIVLP